MANFMGGSAPAMASQIAEGFILLNLGSLKSFLPGELALLRQELERLQRDTRGEVPPPDDALATQQRHRKIARITSAIQVVQNRMTARG
jgi:hypothetical protein